MTKCLHNLNWVYSRLYVRPDKPVTFFSCGVKTTGFYSTNYNQFGIASVEVCVGGKQYLLKNPPASEKE